LTGLPPLDCRLSTANDFTSTNRITGNRNNKRPVIGNENIKIDQENTGHI